MLCLRSSGEFARTGFRTAIAAFLPLGVRFGDRCVFSGRIAMGPVPVEVGLVEGVQQRLLRGGDGLRVERGDLRGGAGLLDGAFGLGGEKGAVAMGVRLALSVRGGDARGTAVGGARRFGRSARRRLTAAIAVRGEAFGSLAAERGGTPWHCRIRPRRRGFGGRGESGIGGFRVKQCGSHFAQTQTHFREIV